MVFKHFTLQLVTRKLLWKSRKFKSLMETAKLQKFLVLKKKINIRKVSLKFELHNQYYWKSSRLTIDVNHEQFDIYQLTKDKEFQYPHFLPSSVVNKSLSPVIKKSPFLLPSHNKNEIDRWPNQVVYLFLFWGMVINKNNSNLGISSKCVDKTKIGLLELFART